MRYAIEQRGSLFAVHLFNDDGTRHMRLCHLHDAHGHPFRSYLSSAPMCKLTRADAAAWAREQGATAEMPEMLAAAPYEPKLETP